MHTLSAVAVSKLTTPGYHSDGGGLYLQISPTGTKSWIFRFKINGRAREMGLGSILGVGLADARSSAAECRRQLAAGIDPIEARKGVRAQVRLEAAKAVTFSYCATAYIDAHRLGWRNAKHVSQWENTIAAYANPVIGSLPVQTVDTGLVMRILEPIWSVKPETASRLRGRIESILDWAKVRGFRQGENPARWRGHLEALLPARSRIRAVKHHAALPYQEIGQLMADLQDQPGIASLALAFTILTAARTGEVIGAKRAEFDLKERVWTVPAERMKARREHRVPLSSAVISLLSAAEPYQVDDYVFPGARPQKHLSNMAMLMLLKRMGRADLTAHGFRSTFRDWAAEQTNYAREVAEAALAHVVGDKVEAAYRRGDMFDKRRRLMNEWARYCAVQSGSAEIVPINRATG
ncbi:integrase [Burkholderiaceae bacterium 26]|nr:integrase [Burkholderiaceae bacterium 26]